ncbi:serine/threonine-protein kinase [Klenkia terrae]|uniref:non-specific serine/threonine protein kinase n=1 Tax=Klenkia terrae TaxID=1052259 RepID=A0ABU8EE15_9ACTN
MEPLTRTVGDRYELRSLIATGGMGQVWRAHDQRLGRAVAVKVLRGEFAGDADFLARFRAEARHAALLGHRNVVAVYDYGETAAPDGEQLAYLVMELVPGDSLAAVRRRQGVLPADQVLEIVTQTAAGLGAAHEVGIVHRDVKPGNLLLRPDGSVAVTDFGISWSAESVALTATGQVIGTAHYLSPEQARGRPATPASDVYALGMVAYELLAGRRAFDGASSVSVALSQIQDEPDPLPADVPGPVRDLVAAMLVKDAAGRLADGDAVVAAATATRAAIGAAGEPTELLDLVPPTGLTALMDPATATGTGAASAPPRRRRKPLLLAGVLAALLLVGGGAALLLGLGGSSGPEGGSASSAATTTAAPSTPDPVTLDAAAYLGRPVSAVTAELTGLGLVVTTEEVAGDGSTAGLVVEVAPVGTALQPGAAVTVRYGSAAPPTTAAPTTEPPVTVVSTQAPAPTTDPPAADTPADPGGGGPGGGGPGNGNGNGNGGPGNGNGNGGGPGNGNGNGNGRGPGAP